VDEDLEEDNDVEGVAAVVNMDEDDEVVAEDEEALPLNGVAGTRGRRLKPAVMTNDDTLGGRGTPGNPASA
jgi:hypothetical protein